MDSKIDLKFSLYKSLEKLNRPKSPIQRDILNNKAAIPDRKRLYGGG